MQFAGRSGYLGTGVSHAIMCSPVVLRRHRIVRQSHLQMNHGQVDIAVGSKRRSGPPRHLGLCTRSKNCLAVVSTSIACTRRHTLIGQKEDGKQLDIRASAITARRIGAVHAGVPTIDTDVFN